MKHVLSVTTFLAHIHNPVDVGLWAFADWWHQRGASGKSFSDLRFLLIDSGFGSSPKPFFSRPWFYGKAGDGNWGWWVRAISSWFRAKSQGIKEEGEIRKRREDSSKAKKLGTHQAPHGCFGSKCIRWLFFSLMMFTAFDLLHKAFFPDQHSAVCLLSLQHSPVCLIIVYGGLHTSASTHLSCYWPSANAAAIAERWPIGCGLRRVCAGNDARASSSSSIRPLLPLMAWDLNYADAAALCHHQSHHSETGLLLIRHHWSFAPHQNCFSLFTVNTMQPIHKQQRGPDFYQVLAPFGFQDQLVPRLIPCSVCIQHTATMLRKYTHTTWLTRLVSIPLSAVCKHTRRVLFPTPSPSGHVIPRSASHKTFITHLRASY